MKIRALKKEIGVLEIAIRALEIDQQSAEADGSLDTQIFRLTEQLSEKMHSLASSIRLMSSKIRLLTSKQELFNILARRKGRTDTPNKGIFLQVIPLFFPNPTDTDLLPHRFRHHIVTPRSPINANEDNDTSW